MPKAFIDFFLGDRLFREMKTPAPADCLRAARALLNLSQRDAAAGAEIALGSLSAAENSKPVFVETNLQLVDFYVRRGIELLGEASIGQETLRTGARWIAPDDPEASQSVKASFHAEDRAVSFRAARALLQLEQAQVAESVGLSLAVVQNLERGKKSSGPYDKLRSWFETAGVEFTGWGDVSTGKYYGVGVRWRTSRPYYLCEDRSS